MMTPVLAMAVACEHPTVPVAGLMTLKLPTAAPPFGMTATAAARARVAKMQVRVVPEMARIVFPLDMNTYMFTLRVSVAIQTSA
jgi:hypothetical protein